MKQREEKIARMKAIREAAEKENRTLTAAERREFDTLEEEVGDLKQRLDDATRLNSVDALSQRTDIGSRIIDGAGSHGLEDRDRRWLLRPEERMIDFVRSDLPDGILPSELNLGRAFRGLVLKDWKGAEAERRAMGEGTGALGGVLLPTTLSGTIIDLARNKARCVQAGALTLPMETPEVTIAKVVTEPTPYWVAENEEITESDATFTPIKLVAVAVACLCRVSLQLIEDVQSFTGTLEEMIASALALEVDRVGLLGSGVGEPRGIWNTDGVGSVSMGTNGAAFTNYDPFLDAIEDIETSNGEATAVIYAPRTKRALAGLKTGITSDNTPLKPPDDFLALKRLVTNQVPIDQTQGSATNASSAFMGGFKNLLFGMRTQLQLDVSKAGDEKTFEKMQVLVRGYLRVDVAVLRPAHLNVITGIIPA